MGEKERFLPLATVRKTFGKGGELILKFRPDVPQNIINQLNTKEPVFIQVDGIPVPFIYVCHLTRNEAMVCGKLSVESLAAEWVGKTILYKQGPRISGRRNPAGRIYLHRKNQRR